eukprot:m.456709 g.456709  ORF g.456709 m.456709 type:complete len:71 (-) comp21575_c0_seq1:2138-2350(-)
MMIMSLRVHVGAVSLYLDVLQIQIKALDMITTVSVLWSCDCLVCGEPLHVGLLEINQVFKWQHSLLEASH